MAQRRKRRPSVRSVIERDARRKFVRAAVKMAPSLRPWKVKTPQTTELGYAKRSKKPLVGAVIESSHVEVSTRPLRKGEKFDIHTHPEFLNITM